MALETVEFLSQLDTVAADCFKGIVNFIRRPRHERWVPV